jgi:hypothetical protein
MSKTVIVALGCVVMLLTPALGNLLTNGDFEQDLSVGWTQTNNSPAGTYSFDRWDTMGQPTPGYAARVYKYLAYYASLSQTVDVPGVNLDLSFDGRLRISGGSSTCWPVGAFIVSYLNATGAELGSTMLILRNQYCTWVESDTLHFIDVTLPGQWVSYNLNVQQEISDHLPGVNAADVSKVEVQLYSYDNGT